MTISAAMAMIAQKQPRDDFFLAMLEILYTELGLAHSCASMKMDSIPTHVRMQGSMIDTAFSSLI
jgi:hypothetical protein